MDPFMSDMASRAGGSAIAKVGTSIIEKLAGKAADVIKDRLAQVNLWSEYERRYIDRYGKVKLTLSGMREAVPLEQIYTGVRFLDGLSIGRFASIEALEQGFREKPRQFRQQDCLPQDGIAVANNHQFLMVLGGPGAGKSTYLRRMGLEALRAKESQFQHECIPVMLELKRFDGEQVDIKAAIAEEFSHIGFDFSAEFVEEALQQGKLLILLDGLDEIPKANQDKVCQAIQDFVSRYDKKHQGNRFIASCRVAAAWSGFTGFTDIELADFDDEQIQKFIDNWFHDELDRASSVAEKCWNLLNDDTYASAKELAQTPLLLTFLCVVYDRTQSFPANRAALYRKALDILLEEWAAEKRIRQEPIYEGLNTELEKVLLAEIAYQGFVQDRLFFTREELINYIQKFLEDSADKPKYLDGKAVLTAIAVQQGILTERAEDIYSFSHLTVQEYLTAQYLSQNPTVLAKAVAQHLTEQRWREVLLLVPGLLSNADGLLIQMQEVAQEKVSKTKLKALISWADQVTFDSANPAPPIAKRALALFLASALELTCTLVRASGDGSVDNALASTYTRSLARSLTSTRDLSKLTSGFDIDSAGDLANLDDSASNNDFVLALGLHFNSGLALVLKRENIFNSSANLSVLAEKLEALQPQVPDNMQPYEVRQAFVGKLLQIWCEALELHQELLKFSENESQSLADYVYICELIVRCKESAVRVSLEVWKSIENAMVMPTPDTES
jgi:NACHT domain